MSQEVSVLAKPLPHAPLIEAVFELHWNIAATGPLLDANAPPPDPGFRILLGRLYDRIRDSLPVVKDLPQSQAPEALTPHIVRHQFRASPDGYPVAQVGPGVFSYNHASGYKWEKFFEGIKKLVPTLFDAYPSDIHQFRPISLQLMYINAIGMKPHWKPTEFLREMLHIGLEVDGPNDYVRDSPSDVNFAMMLPINSPRGVVNHIFATNKDPKGVQGILWHIIVSSQGDDVPVTVEGITDWAQNAHEVAKSWFSSLSRGKLMESFTRENG
jgi:uncharacterized protein (TIGR04255 family)